jgi:hypothetical protein
MAYYPVLRGFAWLWQQANAVKHVVPPAGRKRAHLLASLGCIHRKNWCDIDDALPGQIGFPRFQEDSA